jgi:Nif-specific regulatory protein
MDALRACDFPGNVRELESCVRRTAALAKSSVIGVEDLACNNGSCLSVMLGKSMSKMQARDAGHSSFPIYTPGEEQNPSIQRFAEPASGTPASGAESPVPAASFNGEVDNSNERQRLVDAMERSGWVQAKAARILRLTPRQMGYALRKHNIEIKRF